MGETRMKKGSIEGGGDGGDRNEIEGIFGGNVGDARIVVRKEGPFALF